ncbi:aminoglycoside phosphotransferase family protein [Oligosphaera ethanolica]|uniref:Aminoglycoside phosphotransferase (APT) family kinase protein n=1 Tax=Oligosphaera ethanolica TaxID=760260 RepID=A0AAE3VK27_9BACT|nr:phosphotransferase [Oligosphaera ethanolica]MDQ0291888.1 aminoglycoside phosphotransferase (APT) family kinase protein [Oligosphaera ethanolica]
MKDFNFSKMEPILQGWSADKKFLVEDHIGNKYFLRISSINKYDSKKANFELMRQTSALGVPMCEPIEFGICQDGCYSLQSWIDGVDLESEIIALSNPDQYAYGMEAGSLLKKIHSIPAPNDFEKWENRFSRKIDKKIRGYHDCPIKFDGSELMIQYINAHRHLLEGRPQCYQHGDYHVGNMMLNRTGQLIIIDFDRDDFGDPWEEFNRIVWSAQQSHFFACGMIDGYFSASAPHVFWDLLALYIASNTLSSIPWAIPFGMKEIDIMKNQAAEILGWYDGMKNTIPTWYMNCKKH